MNEKIQKWSEERILPQYAHKGKNLAFNQKENTLMQTKVFIKRDDSSGEKNDSINAWFIF